MTRDTLDRFKLALAERRNLLLDWVGRKGSKTNINFDDTLLEAVDETIKRIEQGNFGTCTHCHGEVETSRLALDYTLSVCLECFSELDRKTLERELEMAAEVQQSLLSREIPSIKGAEVAVHAQPAGIVGGDYFDFFPAPGGVQSVAIGDVMGKGLPASMLMSSLQTSLQILGPEHHDLAVVAQRVNQLFRHNLQLIRFISLIMARVDPEEGCIRYLNAGHNPALLWRASDATGHWLQPTGPAIGLLREPTFTSETIDLAPQDLLVLYTDGLIEARDADGKEFGDKGLLAFTSEHASLGASEFVTVLKEEVLKFGGAKLRDDLTLIVIKSTPTS